MQHRHAKAGSEMQACLFQPYLRLLHRIAKALRYHCCLCLVGVRQDDREFFTTDSSNNILQATLVFQDFCKAFQRYVTCGMSMRVIDLLEVVDITHDEAHRCPGAAAL